MNKYILKNKLIVTLSSLLLTASMITPRAIAQEIVITGNGDGSTNEVHITENNQTNTDQTNNASITNTVSATADTGNNTAVNNTGDTTNINTGAVVLETDVANVANTSVINQSCCPNQTPSTINITGNGADSQNNTTVNTSSVTSISVFQNATIINNITETANTGNNNADYNTGNVNINTGNIFSNIKINNGHVNSTQVQAQGGTGESFKIDISNNGHNSENNISLTLLNNRNVITDNQSDIKNNIESILNTGNNTANGNNGDVFIRTGDIISNISIHNALNANNVILNCCPLVQDVSDPAPKENQPTSLPQPQNIPPVQPSPVNPIVISQSGSSNPPTQIGQVAAATAAAISKILPVTGNNLLFFYLLGSLAMFFLGAYLRLHSGNSPGINSKFAY